MELQSTRAQYDALHQAAETPRGRSTRVEKEALAAILRDHDGMVAALRSCGVAILDGGATKA